ncbi:MAG TPA: DUF4249 domain-containing protein [Bacteroidales bacterium]|nr:DUF4249 domain-containing protein [Bacteroidales bacterium]HQI46261.1 DUF4249 domain-containing protein [Bacteroidales bacterium]
MKISFIFFIVIILFGSCMKEIPLNEEAMISKLVVNSIITPDSAINVQITKTIPITSNEPREVLNAIVSLYEEGNLIDTLFNKNDGFYMLGKFPEIGKLYELKVDADGFNSVSTKEIIPSGTTKITECTFHGPVGYDAENDCETNEVNIKFNDNGNEKNYYEIIFYSLINNKKHFSYQNGIYDNPILNNEGDKDYYPSSIFFCDELFNGKECNFTIKATIRKPDADNKLFVILRTTSYNYYKYRKLWTRHYQNQSITEYHSFQDIFKGEPIEMFTNVSNGYGIFAGYSEDEKEVIVIP